MSVTLDVCYKQRGFLSKDTRLLILKISLNHHYSPTFPRSSVANSCKEQPILKNFIRKTQDTEFLLIFNIQNWVS